MQFLSLLALATAVFSAPFAPVVDLALGGAAIIGSTVAVAEIVKNNRLRYRDKEQQYAIQNQNTVIEQQQQQLQQLQQQQIYAPAAVSGSSFFPATVPASIAASQINAPPAVSGSSFFPATGPVSIASSQIYTPPTGPVSSAASYAPPYSSSFTGSTYAAPAYSSRY